MEISLKIEDQLATIFLSGDVVIYQNAELKETLAQLQETCQTRIIIDFSAVNYIDSASIGALMSYKSLIEKTGGRVLLCALNKAGPAYI